jgi:multidrug resistance efflux pump
MDVDSEIKQRIHDQEVKRMQGTYGPDAEMPRSPYGQVAAEGTAPVTRTAERINELSKHVSEAASRLQGARVAFDKAKVHLEKSQASYVEAAQELARLMNEHAEGTPENVPYPR